MTTMSRLSSSRATGRKVVVPITPRSTPDDGPHQEFQCCVAPSAGGNEFIREGWTEYPDPVRCTAPAWNRDLVKMDAISPDIRRDEDENPPIVGAPVPEPTLPDFSLERVTKRVSKDHPGWSQDRIRAAENDYRVFLARAKTATRQQLIPTRDVDEVWHAHILFTKQYHADCMAYLGYYLHHEPFDETNRHEINNDRTHTSIPDDIHAKDCQGGGDGCTGCGSGCHGGGTIRGIQCDGTRGGSVVKTKASCEACGNGCGSGGCNGIHGSAAN